MKRILDLISRTLQQKNDSSSSFFRIRNITFDLYSERQKIFFKNEVKYICVTLDKVTVQRTSYTVILTYFFAEGKLHIILNNLVKLSTDEYDADGTAEMVISCLLETLGVSRSKLALMLVHFVYDGVYASKMSGILPIICNWFGLIS